MSDCKTGADINDLLDAMLPTGVNTTKCYNKVSTFTNTINQYFTEDRALESNFAHAVTHGF